MIRVEQHEAARARSDKWAIASAVVPIGLMIAGFAIVVVAWGGDPTFRHNATPEQAWAFLWWCVFATVPSLVSIVVSIIAGERQRRRDRAALNCPYCRFRLGDITRVTRNCGGCGRQVFAGPDALPAGDGPRTMP